MELQRELSLEDARINLDDVHESYIQLIDQAQTILYNLENDRKIKAVDMRRLHEYCGRLIEDVMYLRMTLNEQYKCLLIQSHAQKLEDAQ